MLRGCLFFFRFDTCGRRRRKVKHRPHEERNLPRHWRKHLQTSTTCSSLATKPTVQTRSPNPTRSFVRLRSNYTKATLDHMNTSNGQQVRESNPHVQSANTSVLLCSNYLVVATMIQWVPSVWPRLQLFLPPLILVASASESIVMGILTGRDATCVRQRQEIMCLQTPTLLASASGDAPSALVTARVLSLRRIG